MGSLKYSRARILFVISFICSIAMVFALPYFAQQPRINSAVAPFHPPLPDGLFSDGEKLIRLPSSSDLNKARNHQSGATIPQLNEEQKILHLLNRAGFGPRPGDVERVREMGIDSYLEEQLHPENISDDFLARPLGALNTLQMSVPETIQFYAPPPLRATPTPTPTPTPAPVTPPPLASTKEAGKEEMNKGEAMEAAPAMQPQNPAPLQPLPQIAPTPAPTPAPRRDPQTPLRELQQSKLLRAAYSEKQLQEVMVDFWFNHFNVFAGKDNARWMVTSYERDVIRPHALGKFKEMLVAVAQSPAMLYYLDNFLSQAEVRRPPESVQLNPANPDNPPAAPPRRPGLNENFARELMELHTLGVDGGYTQQDVVEVARAFTGWSLTPQPNAAFVFRPRIHDKGEKRVLGLRLAQGGGIEDGLRVIEILSRHSSTARFISYKLCRRFVADEPPASLVDLATEVFKQTDGDIRQVVKTILTSPEFYSPQYYRNKIKSPLEIAASAIRATGASSDGFLPLIQWVSRMGEPLYLCQPPTGYDENSSQWLSNATLLERMNFAVTLIDNRINGTRVDVFRFVAPDAIRHRDRLLDKLLATLVHSEVSDETRDNLARVVDQSRNKMTPARYDDRAARKNAEQLIGAVSALILGSREFQMK